MPDDPVAVDQVGDAAREEPEGPRHAVPRPDGAVGVGEQQERQAETLGEPPMRIGRIGADADHLGAGLAECLMAVAERARFHRAGRRVVLRVEEQHDLGLPPEVGEPHGLSRRRRQREIRRGITDA